MHHVALALRPTALQPVRLSQRPTYTTFRQSSTSSNKRWQQRQFRDHFKKAAEVQGLKSRAAFKLLELDARHKIFAPGQTVFDLGFAPGSWSQIAVERTKPNGRVIGLDILPCQPPRGVSSIQGNFLDAAIREDAKAVAREWELGRARKRNFFRREEEAGGEEAADEEQDDQEAKEIADAEDQELNDDRSYIDMERSSSSKDKAEAKASINGEETVDVVLSDMSAPWPQMSGFWRRSLSEPYRRLMDTSGIPFRDHAGSMDLCNAALDFALETVKPKGHFICKFYQGAEEGALKKRLKEHFGKVVREKPESSRKESKEMYFVALRRKRLRKSRKMTAAASTVAAE